MWYGLKSIRENWGGISFYLLQKPISMYHLVFIFSQSEVFQSIESQSLLKIRKPFSHLSGVESDELRIRNL